MKKINLLILIVLLAGCATATPEPTWTPAPTIAPTDPFVPSKTPAKVKTWILPTPEGMESWRIKEPTFATDRVPDVGGGTFRHDEGWKEQIEEIAVVVAEGQGIKENYRWEFFTYLTSVNFEDVKKYYDEQTSKNGYGSGEVGETKNKKSQGIRYLRGETAIYVLYWQRSVGFEFPNAFVIYENVE